MSYNYYTSFFTIILFELLFWEHTNSGCISVYAFNITFKSSVQQPDDGPN